MTTPISTRTPFFIHLILSEENHNRVNRAVFEKFLEIKSSSTLVFYEGKKVSSWETLGAHSIEEEPRDTPLSLQGCIQALYLNFILQEVCEEIDTQKEVVYQLLSELLLTCFQSPRIKDKLLLLPSRFDPREYGYPVDNEIFTIRPPSSLNHLILHLEELYSSPSDPREHYLFFSFCFIVSKTSCFLNAKG